jgi:predicted nuclease of predicted toxin-antitoxin system
MKFFVDAQLPPALARWLAEEGHDAKHVADLGMKEASDRHIWCYAKDTGAVLITKDEDFLTIRTLDPTGPAIVWLRIGNTTRRALLERMAIALPAILAALAAGEPVVEVI